MNRCFLAAIILSGLVGSGAPAASQEAIDEIPLTREALRALPVDQLARRLLGPNAEPATQWLPHPGNSFWDLHFLTAPRPSAPGLCERTVHRVRLVGSYEDPPLLEMEIAHAESHTRYMVIGDLRGPERDSLTETEFEACNNPRESIWGYSAPSRDDAVRELLFFTMAMDALQVGDSVAPEIDCSALQDRCDDAGVALTNLTIEDIVSVETECSARPTDACHSFIVHDNQFAWFLEIETNESNRIIAFRARVVVRIFA